MGGAAAVASGPGLADPPFQVNNYFTEMCSGSEAGSYLRLIDSCITQRKAQGRSRTCNESKEEEEERSRLQHSGLRREVLSDSVGLSEGPT